jgi:hypothetical protein
MLGEYSAIAFPHVEIGRALFCLLCLDVRLTPPEGGCLRYGALCPPLATGIGRSVCGLPPGLEFGCHG